MEEIAGKSIATLTLPRFWIENPPLWFALVEAKLAFSQISAPVTKYFYLLEALPQHVATEVRHYHYAGHNNILQRTQVGINCTACPSHQRPHVSENSFLQRISVAELPHSTYANYNDFSAPKRPLRTRLSWRKFSSSTFPPTSASRLLLGMIRRL